MSGLPLANQAPGYLSLSYHHHTNTWSVSTKCSLMTEEVLETYGSYLARSQTDTNRDGISLSSWRSSEGVEQKLLLRPKLSRKVTCTVLGFPPTPTIKNNFSNFTQCNQYSLKYQGQALSTGSLIKTNVFWCSDSTTSPAVNKILLSHYSGLVS